jgi:glycosyltransferase involved in cell wall biosynthesis
MVTSWKVKCGIFTYTQNLVHALADLDVESYIVRLPRFGQKTPEMLQNIVDSIPVDKVDLIHVQHEYGLYQGLEGGFYAALKRLGKPIITTMHAIGVRWDVDRVIASTSDKVIVHNEFCARRFGFSSVVIPHGTKPCEVPSAEEAKRSLGIDPRVPIVGYCGFISEYKGLETLFEAMVKVPKVAVLVGGGWFAGPGTAYIENLKQKSLAALPGRCQWLGYVADEKLPTVYGAMDLVVYPSRFATESGALLMALSHGKAVLASNVPPFKEKEKQGALITFKDVGDLRRKIKRLLRDEDLRMKLAEGAKRFSYQNRWEVVAKTHIKLYEDVLEA